MNVMNEEAKLENHEQVIFISLADLREKAIPRKGVVMQRKNDGEKKEVIHRNGNHTDVSASPKVSMELPSMAAKADRPQNNSRRGSTPKKETQNNNRRPANNAEKKTDSRRNNERRNNEQAKRKTETKNVTVRTFGRKKKEGEEQ